VESQALEESLEVYKKLEEVLEVYKEVQEFLLRV
jgi:hypothetical protein